METDRRTDRAQVQVLSCAFAAKNELVKVVSLLDQMVSFCSYRRLFENFTGIMIAFLNILVEGINIIAACKTMKIIWFEFFNRIT